MVSQYFPGTGIIAEDQSLTARLALAFLSEAANAAGYQASRLFISGTQEGSVQELIDNATESFQSDISAITTQRSSDRIAQRLLSRYLNNDFMYCSYQYLNWSNPGDMVANANTTLMFNISGVPNIFIDYSNSGLTAAGVLSIVTNNVVVNMGAVYTALNTQAVADVLGKGTIGVGNTANEWFRYVLTCELGTGTQCDNNDGQWSLRVSGTQSGTTITTANLTTFSFNNNGVYAGQVNSAHGEFYDVFRSPRLFLTSTTRLAIGVTSFSNTLRTRAYKFAITARLVLN